MPANIETLRVTVEESLSVRPGQMHEIETPAGPLQIIGTARGFVLRRPDARSGADIPYEEGQTLKIKYKDGRELHITAEKPLDWEASDMLDPML